MAIAMNTARCLGSKRILSAKSYIKSTSAHVFARRVPSYSFTGLAPPAGQHALDADPPEPDPDAFPPGLRKTMARACQQQNAAELLRIMRDIAADPRQLTALPHASIFEAMQVMHADRLYEPVRALHVELSDDATRSTRTEPQEDVGERFLRLSLRMSAARRAAPLPLTAPDYAFELAAAAALGARDAAAAVWDELQTSGVRADAECYNRYLAAVAAAGLVMPTLREYRRAEKFRLLAQRLHESAGVGGAGGGRSRRFRAIHLKPAAVAADVFERMAADGVAPDERTVCLLIQCLARSKRLGKVAALLKAVWHVDVPALMGAGGDGGGGGKASPLGPVRAMPRDSPLHPTPLLLHTLAEEFGANDEVYTAFRLVDYLHKQYDVEIPLAVWERLLEWAYVMANPTTDRLLVPTGWRRSPLKSRRDVVQRLWHIMTSPPHRQQPDSGMMDLFIKNMLRAQQPRPMLELMRRGRQLYAQSRRAFEVAARKLALVEALRHRGVQFCSDGLSVPQLRRELERARLRERHHRRLGQVWLRAYLRLSILFIGMPQFERITVPHVVADWISIHNNWTRYIISSGLVQLQLPSDSEWAKPPSYDILTGGETIYNEATGQSSLAL